MSEIPRLALPGDGEEDEVQLEIDDSLPPLERFKVYLASSLLLHRLHVLRETADIVRNVGYDAAVAHIVPLLSELAREQEPVMRQALVEQLPALARFFADHGKDGYTTVLLPVILDVLSHLIQDQNPQVRQSAGEALVAVAPLIHAEDHEIKLLKIVKVLAEDLNEEEFRVDACGLFRNLSPVFGAELCTSFIKTHLSKLAADTSSFRVRKAVAANVQRLLQTLGRDLTAQYILPLFVELSKDEIWGVRKACAESLVSLSEFLPDQSRADCIVPMLESLANDSSRWVRSAVYQNLGPLITTFPSAAVSSRLLRYYTEMAEEHNDAKFGDSDAIIYCAFSFPGVLQTVGSARWDKELKDTYFALVKDLQWKVRQTLSHSIHEVAKILGTEMTETCLLSVFELFLRDLDEVKVGVLRNFAKFLRVLSPSRRSAYLPVLQSINSMESSNWRFRRLIAKQLGELGELYDSASIASDLVPLALALCKDQVYEVRKSAAASIGKILLKLSAAAAETDASTSAVEALPQFLKTLLALATSTHYTERQTFATISLHMAMTNSFRAELLAPMCTLASDRVPNVRLAVARFFSVYNNPSTIGGAAAPAPAGDQPSAPATTEKDEKNKDEKAPTEEQKAILLKLRSDRDRDVRYNVTHRPRLKGYPPPPPPGADAEPEPDLTLQPSPPVAAVQSHSPIPQSRSLGSASNSDDDDANDSPKGSASSSPAGGSSESVSASISMSTGASTIPVADEPPDFQPWDDK